MSVASLVAIAVLFGTGSFLLMHCSLTRIILGVVMLGNGINVLIVSTSSRPAPASCRWPTIAGWTPPRSPKRSGSASWAAICCPRHSATTD